jgi:hypothetical protein
MKVRGGLIVSNDCDSVAIYDLRILTSSVVMPSVTDAL